MYQKEPELLKEMVDSKGGVLLAVKRALWASLVAQLVKNTPIVQETQVLSLGWEDLLEKKMATYTSILAWEIPWTEEPGRRQSMGSQELNTTKQLNHI